MYKAFFGMVNTPFSRKVPPEALYSSQAMDECLGRMKYVSSEQLLAVVTSDPGCGKSTMIRRLVHELPSEQYISLYLSDSKLTPKWLYNGLIQQLGGTQKFYRGDAKIELQREIELIRGMQNKKVVCILDEAHLLDKETLEELRFFMNTKIDSESPLALILVGQTELRTDKLNLQRYAAMRRSASGSISTAFFPTLTGQRRTDTSLPICLMPGGTRRYSHPGQWMRSTVHPPEFRE